MAGAVHQDLPSGAANAVPHVAGHGSWHLIHLVAVPGIALWPVGLRRVGRHTGRRHEPGARPRRHRIAEAVYRILQGTFVAYIIWLIGVPFLIMGSRSPSAAPTRGGAGPAGSHQRPALRS
ncbi:hypothetical protein [Nonomuraea sp. NPDC049480]|uniref:hypothetical protein n=1 Tax=Nonomuraea sp. NPDC049480 TaxID=3364353 RepID=UPI00378DA0E3